MTDQLDLDDVSERDYLNDKIKLSPCPFCGPGPEVELQEFGHELPYQARIYCHGCDLLFPGQTKFKSSELAALAWNRGRANAVVEAASGMIFDKAEMKWPWVKNLQVALKQYWA